MADVAPTPGMVPPRPGAEKRSHAAAHTTDDGHAKAVAVPADYWVLQVPAFGAAWGEGGYARVLRSEAAIFDAVAIDPMV